MSSRASLKTYFNTGDKPTETQFADLINSLAHQSEDSLLVTGGPLGRPASGDLSNCTIPVTGVTGTIPVSKLETIAIADINGLQAALDSKYATSGGTITQNVEIEREWTSNPVGKTNALIVSRRVSGAATITDNSALVKLEHIANSPFPYAGLGIYHNTTVPGANPGGSFLLMGGPTNSFELKFDYLVGSGAPSYEGDTQYILSGAASKHIFIVNNTTEVFRTDATGAAVATGTFRLPPWTIGTLPSASVADGGRVRLVDSSPPQKEAYSDGTAWRYASDDSLV